MLQSYTKSGALQNKIAIFFLPCFMCGGLRGGGSAAIMANSRCMAALPRGFDRANIPHFCFAARSIGYFLLILQREWVSPFSITNQKTN